MSPSCRERVSAKEVVQNNVPSSLLACSGRAALPNKQGSAWSNPDVVNKNVISFKRALMIKLCPAKVFKWGTNECDWKYDRRPHCHDTS
eukprot:778896-Amphidinium_carterae.1